MSEKKEKKDVWDLGRWYEDELCNNYEGLFPKKPLQKARIMERGYWLNGVTYWTLKDGIKNDGKKEEERNDE